MPDGLGTFDGSSDSDDPGGLGRSGRLCSLSDTFRRLYPRRALRDGRSRQREIDRNTRRRRLLDHRHRGRRAGRPPGGAILSGRGRRQRRLSGRVRRGLGRDLHAPFRGGAYPVGNRFLRRVARCERQKQEGSDEQVLADAAHSLFHANVHGGDSTEKMQTACQYGRGRRGFRGQNTNGHHSLQAAQAAFAPTAAAIPSP